MALQALNNPTGLTAKQMVYEAKIFYEDIASNNAPSFTDREWSVILTNAQNQVVQEIYRKGFDKDEEGRLAIQSLFKEWSYSNFESGALRNSVELPLPTDLMYISYESCDTDVLRGAKVLPMPYDAFHTNMENPFKRPVRDVVWRVIGYRDINLLVSLDTVIKYGAVYIKRPTPIIVSNLKREQAIETISGQAYRNQTDCILHANVHRRIVQAAARIAYASTQEQLGYQIQDIETNRN